MITYVTGDATVPQISDGLRVILHVCNDQGGWGAGFVLALDRRFGHGPRSEYKRSRRTLGHFTVWHDEQEHIAVVNMVAQRSYVGSGNPVAVRYLALAECLQRLALGFASPARPISFHLPRIGCGLGGGSWLVVEALLLEFQASIGDPPVYVYDLP